MGAKQGSSSTSIRHGSRARLPPRLTLRSLSCTYVLPSVPVLLLEFPGFKRATPRFEPCTAASLVSLSCFCFHRRARRRLPGPPRGRLLAREDACEPELPPSGRSASHGEQECPPRGLRRLWTLLET